MMNLSFPVKIYLKTLKRFFSKRKIENFLVAVSLSPTNQRLSHVTD